MSNSNVYKTVINVSGITNGTWTEIKAPTPGSKLIAKLEDSSGWKLSLDSNGSTYFSVLSEFCEENSFSKNQSLFWVKSNSAGPLLFQLIVVK